MLSNQISFATDDMTSLLQNPISDFTEMYPNYPTPFDVYFNNNNNANLYIPPNSPPQSSTPTQNTTNVTFTSFPLSHVKVSNSSLEEDSESAFLESITRMDQEFIRALDDIALSSPSSPEMNMFMTPPTDDSPTKTDAPAPMWQPPVQYPRKLVTPVGLNELPNLVAFPPDKRLFNHSSQFDIAQLNYSLLQQQHQQRMYQQQMQHQQMQQQQQAMYEINNYMMQQHLQKMQQQQNAMKVHKTQSFPEERFRHQAAMYEQQFVPYTHDDGLVPQPPKLHKVRSNEEYPSPETIATAMAMKKRRTLSRRSSCSDITRSPGRPRSNSSPANARRPRARSISSVIQDPEVEAMLSDPNLSPQTPSESRFRLLHEPNPQQRKSYQNENRYLAPSPLIVMARVPEAVSGGAVSVRAVHASDCTDFPKNVLGESELKQNLDDGGKAHFVMKCAETTGNQQVRLKFTVRYVSGGVLYEEVIYSQAFYISSHTGKRTEIPST